MIVVRLKGGLGNQLFQFSAGFALARRHRVGLILDTWHYSQPLPPGKPARTFDLEPYRLPVSIRRHRIGRVSDKLFRTFWRFDEDGHDEQRFAALGSSVALDGYFQHPGYFRAVEAELKALLAPLHAAFTPELRDHAPHRIGVQVRRSDYLSDPENRTIYNLCGPAYYRAAWEQVRARVPHAVARIFTDDREWAARELAFLNAEHIEEEATGPHGYVHKFERLRACGHYVIANSSYGWWAAWLGARPESVVIAPREWRNGISTHQLGLALPGWLCI